MPQSTRAKKPSQDFPLLAHARGYGAKKVRGRLVYFRKIADDPDGKSSLGKWREKKEVRLAGQQPRSSRPQDPRDLIRILDGEIRLITPTDPEGRDADGTVTQTEAGQKYFQPTHDYLVHSLRDWLTRMQKETRKGRAELKLFDTSLTWNASPENRFLPSWWEHLTIRFFTDKKKWTEPQRKIDGYGGADEGHHRVEHGFALFVRDVRQGHYR